MTLAVLLNLTSFGLAVVIIVALLIGTSLIYSGRISCHIRK